MAEARQRWKAGQACLDAKRLVFVDETGASTKMVRTHGRCAAAGGWSPKRLGGIGRPRPSRPDCAATGWSPPLFSTAR